MTSFCLFSLSATAHLMLIQNKLITAKNSFKYRPIYGMLNILPFG